MNQFKTKNNIFFAWIPYLVFFAGSFIYFAFFANYLFFYQEKSSLFVFSGSFLIENLHQPGGLLIWIAKFLSTFYYYPLAGALILSSVLTLIILFISKVILLLKGSSSKVLPIIIGLSLFYLQTDYRFLLFNDLGLLLQLALFWLVIKYLHFLKGWAGVILVPVWFYGMGGFTWVFMLLMTFYFIFEKENKGWIRLIALWGLSFLTFFISKEYLFFQSGKTLLTFPYTYKNTGSQQILFLINAGIISIIPLISKIRIPFRDKIHVSNCSVSIISSLILVIGLVLISILKFDNKTKQYLHVEELFYQNKFDEVIA